MSSAAGREAGSKAWVERLLRSQEGIVFLLALVAFVVFSVLLPGFLSAGNLLVLVRSVSILGILALGSKESLRFSQYEPCYEKLDAREKLYRKVR